MARQRKEKEEKIKLKQPDRSGPSRQTLLDIAESRGLLSDENTKPAGIAEDGQPLIGRVGESMFWSISLTMLHFTLDVLVAHQYAVEILWRDLVTRALQAFPIIFLLVYTFHQHPTPSGLFPPLPRNIQPILHQLLFLTTSISAGCYLIHITNTFSYYAVMKQSPPLGCLWIWSVIELDLVWACTSLLACISFLKIGKYNYL